MYDGEQSREKECFDFLRKITKDIKYVVIGGYAVTSFGFSRFSVDLDITIPENEHSFFKKLLSDNSFVLATVKDDLAYSGKFERYKKGLVSIDLLINGVKSCQTGYFYTFEYIYKNSEIRLTSGWDIKNTVNVNIAKKEMLISLKIHSMRMSDIRDIIMLCYEKPDVEVIFDHLKHGPRQKIKEHIDGLLRIISEDKFKDSLKGVYSINDKIYDRAVKNCKFIMAALKEKFNLIKNK